MYGNPVNEVTMSAVKISDVFVPRSPEVNYRSYVVRDYLEESLIEGVEGSNHLLLYGESGTGKSWLYKKVFQEKDIHYNIVDLALAAARSDLGAALRVTAEQQQPVKITGYKETKKASAKAVFAEGGLEHEKQYQMLDSDPFLECLKFTRAGAKKKKAVLVFDNFERILNKTELVEAFSNYLVLLDNPLYAKSNVKILIVGVPVDFGRFFSQVDHAHIVVNRVEELPEVDRFNDKEITKLVIMGFVNELKFNLDPNALGTLVGYISHFSDQIPQHVQALCKLFAKDLTHIKDRTILEVDVQQSLMKSLAEWISHTMQSDYTQLKKVNHEKDPFLEIVLIALGRIQKHEFEGNDILDEIERMLGINVNINEKSVQAALKFLSKHDVGIIKETPVELIYCFSNPKHRIAIRIMTHVSNNQDGEKEYSLKDLISTANSIKWMRRFNELSNNSNQ